MLDPPRPGDKLGGGASGCGSGDGKGEAGQRPCLDAAFSTSSSVGLWLALSNVFWGTFGGEGVLSGVEMKSPKSPKSLELSKLEAATELDCPKTETEDKRELVAVPLVEEEGPCSSCECEDGDADRKDKGSSMSRFGVGGKGLSRRARAMVCLDAPSGV